MKAVSNFHPQYSKNGWDFSLLGEIIHEVNESEPYEEDEAKLLKNRSRYSLIQATGCSCWDGDWEGWTDLTKAEVRKLGKSWANGYGASKTLGKWIEANF